MRNGWADYFEKLATPENCENFDNDHKSAVESDIDNLTNIYTENRMCNITRLTEPELERTIKSFKNGKAPDEARISAEHLKYGGPTLIKIFNRNY